MNCYETITSIPNTYMDPNQNILTSPTYTYVGSDKIHASTKILWEEEVCSVVRRLLSREEVLWILDEASPAKAMAIMMQDGRCKRS